MNNSCPYCAQTNTRKDNFGYCKKYNCFDVSGTKTKLEELKCLMSKARKLPTYKRNVFDNTHYNPREVELRELRRRIVQLLGFLPMECTENHFVIGNVQIGVIR
jgi:hypothetical protein